MQTTIEYFDRLVKRKKHRGGTFTNEQMSKSVILLNEGENLFFHYKLFGLKEMSIVIYTFLWQSTWCWTKVKTYSFITNYLDWRKCQL